MGITVLSEWKCGTFGAQLRRPRAVAQGILPSEHRSGHPGQELPTIRKVLGGNRQTLRLESTMAVKGW